MKTSAAIRLFRSALAAAALLAASNLSAHEGKDHTAKSATDTTGAFTPVDAKTDATWLASARASYPLKRCPVCDDALEAGKDGKFPEYVYHQDGKPDRLVRLCDHDECVVNFKKDPQKYLAIIDAAANAGPAKK